MKFLANNINTILLLMIALALGAILMRLQMTNKAEPETIIMMNPPAQAATSTPNPATATETIPPFTPFASFTPTQTLKPPPTFEPPTATPAPSLTPSTTPSPTIDAGVSLDGLRGLESPTPITTPEGCEKREDWTLRYTVQPNEALEHIATRYSTSVEELSLGNCLADANLIREGQVLRVPGAAQPVQPEVVCTNFELLTPFNDSQTVQGEGTLTFNWRGPEAPRNLLRITRPNGTVYEQLVELRQNAIVDLVKELPAEGRYYWIIRPLNMNFVQVCPDSPTWTFVKKSGPTATPITPTMTNVPQQVVAGFQSDVMGGFAPLTVQFLDKSSGPVVSYFWNFGTGATSTARDPIYTFTAAGTYIVSLTVVSNEGVVSESRTIFVVN